jgi:hypothetical protein
MILLRFELLGFQYWIWFEGLKNVVLVDTLSGRISLKLEESENNAESENVFF